MITQLFLEFIFAIPLLLLSNFVGFVIELPGAIFGPLVNIVSGVGTAMPVRQLLPILAIEFTIMTARIAWALILRVKSFIPFMGA